MKQRSGFTMIEILAVIAIIGIISAIAFVYLNAARVKGRDVKRKADISQFGKYLTASCYLPDAGGGEYDLADLLVELKIKYPQLNEIYSQTPKDPGPGNDSESFYKYIVSSDGEDCAMYANLEYDNEPVTLAGITTPTAGVGVGVLEATSPGWNGTQKYFQYGN